METRRFFCVLSAVLFAAASLIPQQVGAAQMPEVAADFKQVVSDLGEFRVAGRTEQALDALLSEAARVLAERGMVAESEQISHEWRGMRARLSLLELGVLDLGDHDPLNEWLARTYAKLEGWAGTEILEFFRLDDIKILNYAIPVVFSPSSWDAKEYKLHFVPFSAVVTYWSSRLACALATSGTLSWFCGSIAEVPRWAVKRWVGPWLSDKVHHRATGTLLATPAELPVDDLGELLERARIEREESGAVAL